jgi:hypothetical protein
MSERELAAQAFVVIRKIIYGPFGGAKAAFTWAEQQWPGEEHDIQGLHDPNKYQPR